MTVTSLLTALAIGLVIGVVGHRIGRSTRHLPLWLPPAVGVGAALLGTIGARLVGIDSLHVSPVEVGLQIGLAALAVAIVVTTTDRRQGSGRYDRVAGTR
ncbi:GlsB/YeaQ/YmgE family stress response membrane protein [Actinoplanes sp. NPDC048967]|uniref:GlsB/YeaQ/YmgE family stress response membrane protein n=1 Tax=Actinoplanes sp. NPDC048967 TaxID=3155269 RepID=UPI0033D36497